MGEFVAAHDTMKGAYGKAEAAFAETQGTSRPRPTRWSRGRTVRRPT